MSTDDITVADLTSLPLFKGIDSSRLDEMRKLLYRGPDSGVLFEAGEPTNSFYILRRGGMTLAREGDDTRVLKPLALIGEIGALVGGNRLVRGTLDAGSEVWILDRKDLEPLFTQHPELAVQIQTNALRLLSDKVERDQRRLHDMRKNLISTQKAMKELRQYVYDSEDTAISSRVHDVLGALIRQNRRVNYRVKPPVALKSYFKPDHGETQEIVEISRTHFSYDSLAGQLPEPGSTISGVLLLSGPEIPIRGKVLRTLNRRVDIELEMMMDNYSSALEGYLTRVQMLDFLV